MVSPWYGTSLRYVVLRARQGGRSNEGAYQGNRDVGVELSNPYCPTLWVPLASETTSSRYWDRDLS